MGDVLGRTVEADLTRHREPGPAWIRAGRGLFSSGDVVLWDGRGMLTLKPLAVVLPHPRSAGAAVQLLPLQALSFRPESRKFIYPHDTLFRAFPEVPPTVEFAGKPCKIQGLGQVGLSCPMFYDIGGRGAVSCSIATCNRNCRGLEPGEAVYSSWLFQSNPTV